MNDFFFKTIKDYAMNSDLMNLKTSAFEVQFEVVDGRVNFVAEEVAQFLSKMDDHLVA